MMIPKLILAMLVSAIFVSACGADDDDSTAESQDEPMASETAPPEDEIATETGPPASLVIASSELVVGPNRFIFGLFDAENRLVEGVDATLTLFADAQEEPRELGVFETQFLPIEFPNEENPPDIGGVYASQLEFAEPGVYGVQVNVEGQGDAPQGLRVFLDVKAEGVGVQVGDPAPATDSPTTDDVEDLKTIDSDDPPNPQLHELSIAEALENGKPTLVSFVTPAFCSSRLCGPMIDVILALYPEYEDRVNFIHIEPFELDDNGEVVSENGAFVDSATFAEWGLAVEPVTFIVGADGIVAFRFESVTTQDELRVALDSILE